MEEDEKRGGGKACGKERKGRESPSRAAAVEAWEDGEVRKGEGGEEGTGTVWLLRCKRGEPPDKLEPSSPSSPVPSFPPSLAPLAAEDGEDEEEEEEEGGGEGEEGGW